MSPNIIIGVRTHLSTFFTSPFPSQQGRHEHEFATDEEARQILKKITHRVWWQGFVWGSLITLFLTLMALQ